MPLMILPHKQKHMESQILYAKSNMEHLLR